MKLKVAPSAEPFAGSSPAKTVRADCHAHLELKRELMRYADNEIPGESVLVAGHRGSGKTTLAHQTIEEVQLLAPARPGQGTSQPSSSLARPLPVFVHGPDLLKIEGEPDDQTTFGHRPSNLESRYDAMAGTALKEIARSLHRSFAEEIATCYEARARHLNQPAADEQAAQLRMELNRQPDLATLREFWDGPGWLTSGVLIDQPTSQQQGYRELSALAMLVEVASEAAESSRPIPDPQRAPSPWIREVSDVIGSGTSVLVAGVGLLSAAIVVGLVLSISHNLVMAVIGAGITGLVTTVLLGYMAGRTKRPSLIVDTTVATFDITLPLLVRRVVAAGLAPVFVVDELDKVPDLQDRLPALIRRIKHFTGDRAFFCFLTDRDYYDFHLAIVKEKAYPNEHTFFYLLLFVSYSPRDLRTYLDMLLGLNPRTDGTNIATDLSAEALKCVILHRARMHVGDIRRSLGKFTDDKNEIDLDEFSLALHPEHRCTVLAQLAVEAVYARPELRDRVAIEPQFAQLTYDALYYPARMWREGRAELDLSFEAFKNYLQARVARLRREPSAVSEPDTRLLYQSVSAVVRLLKEPRTLEAEVRHINYWTEGLSQTFQCALGAGPLLRDTDDGRCEWVVDESGRGVNAGSPQTDRLAREAEGPVAVNQACAEILDLDNLLRDFSGDQLSLATLPDSFTPLLDAARTDWAKTSAAIDRFRREGLIKGPYSEEKEDADTIQKCYETLNKASARLCTSIFCAWMLSHDLAMGAQELRQRASKDQRLIDSLDPLALSLRDQVPPSLLPDVNLATVLAGVGIRTWLSHIRRLMTGFGPLPAAATGPRQNSALSLETPTAAP
ncbi:MAG: hypothetical protein ABSF98_14990 [Bryobacteraceae bacterium]